MKFGVAERLHLLGVTRHMEGNLVTLRVVRDLQNALGFSDEETQAINLRSDADGAKWDLEPEPKEVEVSPTAREAVVSAFRQFERREALTMDLLPLYEKFLEK